MYVDIHGGFSGFARRMIVTRRRHFLAIWVDTSSETLEIRPAILHSDILLLVGL